LNHGIGSYNTFGLIVQNNVIHRSFRNSIDVDEKSRQISILSNFVVGNLRSPDYTNEWIQPFAGIYIQTTDILSVKGNVVSGSQDTGITVRPELCSTASPVIIDNEVQGAYVGLYILSRSSPTCVQLTRFTAWKCAHLGIVTVDQLSNIVLDSVFVSDNHVGISLNFIQGTSTSSLVRADVKSSFIFGSTAASTCSDSVDCRAMTKEDIAGLGCGSVFGSAYRRVGIISSQYLNAPKTCENSGKIDNCRPPNLPDMLCKFDSHPNHHPHYL
jgi:hypothetical protein